MHVTIFFEKKNTYGKYFPAFQILLCVAGSVALKLKRFLFRILKKFHGGAIRQIPLRPLTFIYLFFLHTLCFFEVRGKEISLVFLAIGKVLSHYVNDFLLTFLRDFSCQEKTLADVPGGHPREGALVIIIIILS